MQTGTEVGGEIGECRASDTKAASELDDDVYWFLEVATWQDAKFTHFNLQQVPTDGVMSS